MPFTTITAPSVGDPTKQGAFAQAVIDDLTFLYSQIGSVIGGHCWPLGASTHVSDPANLQQVFGGS